ncbi:MAG: hypothetical protein MI923_09420 [Phycisphaerales bacterium]|nr:hypothetical protein [Phycisphaerales bacterium]
MHSINRSNPEHHARHLVAGAIRKRLAILGTAIIAIANSATAETKDENAAATVTAEVIGRQITWRVTNHSDVPITRVHIPTCQTYDHVVPDYWNFEKSNSSMHAWAKDERGGIRKDQSREFRLTGGASGSKPGRTTAEITMADDRVVHVESVMTFQEEPWTATALPPVLVAGLVFILVLWRSRKRP